MDVILFNTNQNNICDQENTLQYIKTSDRHPDGFFSFIYVSIFPGPKVNKYNIK